MLFKVDSSSRPKRQVLEELGIPKSTYYRWRKKLERNEGLSLSKGSVEPSDAVGEIDGTRSRYPVSRVEQPSVGIVDHRCVVLPGLRLGVLLPGYGDG